MPTFSPLRSVAEAVFGALQDNALDVLAPGGVHTDVPPDPGYPFVWFEVFETEQFGGFGTRPGRGALPEVEIRVHVFQSDNGTIADAQYAMERAIELLVTPGILVVPGYEVCGEGPFHDGTVPLPDEELNGIKVRELVATFRLYVEEQ